MKNTYLIKSLTRQARPIKTYIAAGSKTEARSVFKERFGANRPILTVTTYISHEE